MNTTISYRYKIKEKEKFFLVMWTLRTYSQQFSHVAYSSFYNIIHVAQCIPIL